MGMCALAMGMMHGDVDASFFSAALTLATPGADGDIVASGAHLLVEDQVGNILKEADMDKKIEECVDDKHAPDGYLHSTCPAMECSGGNKGLVEEKHSDQLPFGTRVSAGEKAMVAAAVARWEAANLSQAMPTGYLHAEAQAVLPIETFINESLKQ